MLRKILMAGYILIAAEIFLRFFSPQPLLPRYVTGTYYGIRGNIPSISYWHTTPDIRYPVRINARGMRADEDFSYEKPKGVQRILVLGDSFMMGYESQLKHSIPSQLGRLLKERGINCQIINLAVSGHGNAEELLALENEGLRYAPDLVLLGWHGTDLEDNLRSKLFSLKNGLLVRSGKDYLPGVKASDRLNKLTFYRWLSENSHLYALIRERLAVTVKNILLKKEAKGSDIRSVRVGEGGNEGAIYAERLTLALLARIRERCSGIGARFVIVDIPGRPSEGVFPSLFPTRKEGREPPLNVINLAKSFKANPGKKIFFERGQSHFTPLGSEIAAKTVEDYLLKNHVLEK